MPLPANHYYAIMHTVARVIVRATSVDPPDVPEGFTALVVDRAVHPGIGPPKGWVGEWWGWYVELDDTWRPATEDEFDATGLHEQRNGNRRRANLVALYQSMAPLPAGANLAAVRGSINAFYAAFRQVLLDFRP